MSKRIYIFFSILLFSFVTNDVMAQNEANYWFFGTYCGMNFNTPGKEPVFENGSQMDTDEGCASISDNKGNLLFYTDGKQVWNREHVQMPNGYDLNGHESSTQSAVVVRKPGSLNEYYIFTVDRQGGTFGIGYSIVDMKLDAGRGDIIEKNVYLHFPVVEKITAVRHENGRDVWIITHEWGSDKFLSYLLTDSGMNEIPVVSSVGSFYMGDNMNAVGYLKAAPDGSYIASAVYWTGIFEILRFDNNSGVLSNPISFDSPDYQTVYGVEFSADVSKVYFSKGRENSTIFQIDLKAGDDNAVKSSLTVIAESYSDWVYQALQIAPNKKIYVAKRNKTYLSAIELPNEKGAACGFVENAFDLEDRKCNAGLPTFNQSFLDLYISITGNTKYCVGDTLLLSCNEYDNASYLWEGPQGFISLTPAIQINGLKLSHSGYYKITINVEDETKSDSIFIEVFDSPEAKIMQGDTAYICAGQTIELVSHTTGNDITYEWSNGEKSQNIEINEIGDYYLVATNSNGCSDTAYITVLPRIPPTPEIISRNGYPKLCPGEMIELSLKDTYVDYLWSTGSKDSLISVTDTGTYYVSVIDEYGCTAQATIIIENYDVLTTKIKSVDFGSTIVGTDIIKTIDFTNEGSDSIYVTSISKLLNESSFILSYTPSIPVWLASGEKIEIEILFRPERNGIFNDSIEIITAFPCNLFENFKISGSSGNLNSVIYLPDTSGKIGDSSFEIPLYANLESTDNYEVSFKAVISFDAKIFLPDENQKIVKDNSLVDGRRVLTLEVENVELSNNMSIIAGLKGTVLLSKGSYPLTIDSFEWNTPYIETDTRNGSLTAFGVCKPDISEIILSNKTVFKISPNPADELITINSDQSSFYIKSINLFDLKGNSHYIAENILVSENSITIFVGRVVPGQYILLVETDTGGFSTQVTIVR